jgi:hypothetical protein
MGDQPVRITQARRTVGRLDVWWLFVWTVEDQYGSRLDFTLKLRDGQTYVYESQTGSEPVFVGSRDEANEYMEQRRAAGESFVVPGAIIAAGAILVIVGVLAGRRTVRSPPP